MSAEEWFERALARDPVAVRALIEALTPVVQLRVARAIARRKSTRALGREVTGEVYDLTQDVFVALFADDARALRAWRKAQGLSLANFVGLLAEHQVATIFRSGRRRPWSEELVLEDDFQDYAAREGETDHAARDLYARVLQRVRAVLTPRGLELFYALIVEEKGADVVAASTGLSRDAIYAWRSRLLKLVRQALGELDPDRLPPPGASAAAGKREGTPARARVRLPESNS